MDNVLSFENVSWRRNGIDILKDIDWTIKQNEHWGILGLNGSGKTSLLNIVNGYQHPSTGKVSVLGNRFGQTNLPELRKKIGYVSSSLDQFSQRMNVETVEEIVVSGKFASFGLYEEVLREDWGRAVSLLKDLRLDYLIGKHYHLLSQGEKRRVLIARALMSNPEILILDEPCSGLDVLSREELLELTNDIITHGCHVIYVTHHIEELMTEITHVLLLRDGEIVASGPKEQVIQDKLLSETFKIPVHVKWEDNRPWLTVKKKKEHQNV